MKKISFGLLLVGLVFATVGCFNQNGGTSTANQTVTNNTVTDTTNSAVPATTQTYTIGEDAAAGAIVHNITSVEVLTEIPESYTLDEWSTIAEAKPADEGFQWLHIIGSVTNNSKESQVLGSTNVVVEDDNMNQFSTSSDVVIYVEDDKSPIYLELQPTQTKEWEGYFLVPTSATGLKLLANDLSFLPESEVYIDLGLDG